MGRFEAVGQSAGQLDRRGNTWRGLERLNQALRHEAPDRVPISAFSGGGFTHVGQGTQSACEHQSFSSNLGWELCVFGVSASKTGLTLTPRHSAAEPQPERQKPDSKPRSQRASPRGAEKKLSPRNSAPTLASSALRQFSRHATKLEDSTARKRRALKHLVAGHQMATGISPAQHPLQCYPTESARAAKIFWTAVASAARHRLGGSARLRQSGVALRFPPQSKTQGLRLRRAMPLR
jgi:hypothetical protein